MSLPIYISSYLASVGRWIEEGMHDKLLKWTKIEA